MPVYVVKGRGIETGRKRNRSFYAKDEDEAKLLAAKDGTTVEEIEELPPEPPTENQLQYARDLNVSFPENISKDDLSDLISRTSRKDKPTTERHRSFSKIYGLEVSEYVGKKELFNRIQYALISHGRELELAEWFTFRVYRELVKGSIDSPIKLPNDPIIQNIAKKIAMDQEVVQSIKRYEGRELIWFGQWTAPDGSLYTGGSNRTAAYKAAAAEIKAQIPAITATKTPPKVAKKTETYSFTTATNQQRNNQPGGCMSVVAAGLIIPPFIYSVGQLFSAIFA